MRVVRHHRGFVKLFLQLQDQRPGVRKVTDGLAELALAPIALAKWKAFDAQGRLFKNINTMADYEEAVAEAEDLA